MTDQTPQRPTQYERGHPWSRLGYARTPKRPDDRTTQTGQETTR